MDYDKSNAVRVAVREAPFRAALSENNRLLNGQKQSVVVYPKDHDNTLVVDGNVYCFDHVFSRGATQMELYDALIHPLVLKVLAGYNCTALAYGQTGTGKSYSMGLSLNAEGLEKANAGVVPRCLADFFENIAATDEQTQVLASFIEIYNEKAYDLLSGSEQMPIVCRGHKFSGGVCAPIGSQQEFQQLLLKGTKRRHVRSTSMNANSSRSHAIFTIHVRNAQRHARLNIVDLAGSEGLRRTGHQGLARSEGVHINQGLLCINKVLLSMSAGHRVIPYRDSALTSVLQESLSCHSYITLLACISPEAADVSETNSTLRFAKNAKQLKLTPQHSQLLSALKRKISQTPYRANAAVAAAASDSAFKRPAARCNVRPPLGARATANNTFCTPGKGAAATQLLQRHRSDMGLTPKAKERARQELQLPLDLHDDTRDSFTSLNISCSTALDASVAPAPAAPSLEDYVKLQTQISCLIEAFKHMQPPEQVPRAPETLAPPSALSYCSFSSPLAERADQTLCAQPPPAKVRCQLDFSQSAAAMQPFPHSSSPRPTPEEISGIAALETSKARPLRRSKRLLSANYACDSLVVNRRSPHHSPAQHMRSCRRRSMRIANQKQAPPPAPAPTKSIVARSSEQLIGSNLSGAGSRNVRLSKHRSSLLAFVNSATPNQLQKLPRIGPKTAFALTMQRIFVGEFKSWAQIKKLPLWPGNAWTRFAEANCLTISAASS